MQAHGWQVVGLGEALIDIHLDMEEENDDLEDEKLDEDGEDEAPSLLGQEGDDDAQSGGEDSSSEAESDVEEAEEWGGFGGSSVGLEPVVDALQAQTSAPAEKLTAGTRYVPPHLRNRQAELEDEKQSEEKIKLTRQLKGLLNRYID